MWARHPMPKHPWRWPGVQWMTLLWAMWWGTVNQWEQWQHLLMGPVRWVQVGTVSHSLATLLLTNEICTPTTFGWLLPLEESIWGNTVTEQVEWHYTVSWMYIICDNSVFTAKWIEFISYNSIFTNNIIVMLSGSSILHAYVIMHVRYIYIICCSSALTSSNYITLERKLRKYYYQIAYVVNTLMAHCPRAFHILFYY